MADRSDYSWGMVEAYERDELADNSADEKRMEKAEKEAERTAAKKKRTKRRGPSSGREEPEQKRLSRWEPSERTGGPARFPPQPPPARQKAIGPCWSCGKLGHLAAACPGHTSKWYPFLTPEDLSDDSCYLPEASQSGKGDVERVYEIDLAGENRVNVTDGLSHGLAEEPMNETLDYTFSTGNSWEVEEKVDGQVDTGVKGRLKECIKFWKEAIEAPAYIIDCIQYGYKLPLISEPPRYQQSNSVSAFRHKDFVTEAVAELLHHCCVKRTNTAPHICSPLSVVVNQKGKKRLVINLRYLNQFLKKDSFKYEDLRTLLSMLKSQDYLFKFDLKSGYHHVEITEFHWKYLGFQWGNVDGQQFYMFTVLPFGLATACYIFTKLMRPLVKRWRGNGLQAVVYLDDGIVAANGMEAAERASVIVRQDLADAGFLAHEGKSQWVPSQKISWLGFDLDLKKGVVSVPPQKIQNLQELLIALQGCPRITAKQLASLVGNIMSMSMALGPVARLMTRSLYALLNSRHSWYEKLQVSPEAMEELQFWHKCIIDFNGQNIWRSPSAVRVIYSDASDTGFGGYMVEHGPQIANGQWSAWESQQSSTWRELRAVSSVLQSFASSLADERIRWFTDNQNVVRILLYGSRKPLLQAEALTVFHLSVTHHLTIEPEWIPRRDNQVADYLSRLVDEDDWMVHPWIFHQLDLMWGPHTVDRFASIDNRQLERFNSRFWNPESEAVDAFTVNWGDDTNWWCPPVGLVPRLIQHGLRTRAVGTLIVPQWPSAPFWPILFPEGSPAVFVLDIFQLPRVNWILVPGRSGKTLFNGPPNTDLLALWLDFNTVFM